MLRVCAAGWWLAGPTGHGVGRNRRVRRAHFRGGGVADILRGAARRTARVEGRSSASAVEP